VSRQRASNSQVSRQAADSGRRSAARRAASKPKRKPRRRAKAKKQRRFAFWRRKRRRGAKPRRGWRRYVAIAGAIGVGGLAGFLITNPDRVEDTLLEVTLPLRHDDIIRQQAAEKGVEAPLIAAIISAESGFRDQTSSAGARGLMQITPQTAEEIEKLSGGETFAFDDLADPDINIRYGTFYIRHLLDLYGGNEVAAIAAYNAGPGQVGEWGGTALEPDDIEFPETREYVDKVLEKREDYRDEYPEELTP
jgi:soluble lytic murein transglycosylase